MQERWNAQKAMVPVYQTFAPDGTDALLERTRRNRLATLGLIVSRFLELLFSGDWNADECSSDPQNVALSGRKIEGRKMYDPIFLPLIFLPKRTPSQKSQRFSPVNGTKGVRTHSEKRDSTPFRIPWSKPKTQPDPGASPPPMIHC
ncbi:hypothetical protein Pla100_22140 [Neorhodopirellula pilleata]|uniref:Uncharacterized protein n=1 Tax=Neorhodopirellula pilleata TaxID=2714738 RepID=A0A5C6AI03_9BACT|nr:hypothetical protein Pla100_22140 [Neorhodopirellula pilleata]